MSTRAIAGIFVCLLIIAGFLFMNSNEPTSMPGTHVMPDGSTMSDDSPMMETMPEAEHVMPDGTMMMNEPGSETQVMPDSATMLDTDTRMNTHTPPTPAREPVASEEMPMDHSMMGHSM